MPERITSKANPRVRALRAALIPHRSDLVVGLEGFHLVEEAIASGLTLETLYLREDRMDALDAIPRDAMRETFILSKAAFQAAVTTENPQGIAATLQRPAANYTPRTGDLILLADTLQDPGNLGTLIRSAEAFGATAVALTAGTVDPFNGKCLRAATGAAFRIPLPTWDEDLAASLAAVDARLFAAIPRDAVPATSADLRGTTVLVIGNEGAGVSKQLLAQAHARITVPTTGPTESLNAAVAGSLLLYIAQQQRIGAA